MLNYLRASLTKFKESWQASKFTKNLRRLKNCARPRVIKYKTVARFARTRFADHEEQLKVAVKQFNPGSNSSHKNT